MTYGPGETLPDLHRDPPERPECKHPPARVYDRRECACCGEALAAFCFGCELWLPTECTCPRRSP